MHDIEDQQLKAELDAIINHVDAIMSRIATVIPSSDENNEKKED